MKGAISAAAKFCRAHRDEPGLRGWLDGHVSRQFVSPREACDLYPAASADWLDAYLNGRDDGVRGDVTRVAMRADR
jgi:hypothetical protein